MSDLAGTAEPIPPATASRLLWQKHLVHHQRLALAADPTMSPSAARAKVYGKVAASAKKKFPDADPVSLIGPAPGDEVPKNA